MSRLIFSSISFPLCVVSILMSGCSTNLKSPTKSEPHALLRMETSLATISEDENPSYKNEKIVLQFYWKDDENKCEGREILSNLGPFVSGKTVRLTPKVPFRFLARNAYKVGNQVILVSKITGKRIKNYSCSAYGEFIPVEGQSYNTKLIDHVDGECSLEIIDDAGSSNIEGLKIENNVCNEE